MVRYCIKYSHFNWHLCGLYCSIEPIAFSSSLIQSPISNWIQPATNPMIHLMIRDWEWWRWKRSRFFFIQLLRRKKRKKLSLKNVIFWPNFFSKYTHWSKWRLTERPVKIIQMNQLGWAGCCRFYKYSSKNSRSSFDQSADRFAWFVCIL